MLIAFLAYKDQFLSRVSQFIDGMVELKMLRLHAERLADIALTDPEQRTWSNAPMPKRAARTIEVRDLSFRYGSNDRWILDDLNLRIEAGESVAIAGNSGCGKTTLLKILAGLLQPTAGAIYVDGEPLSRLGLERYRSILGVVMQDDHLFAGSIGDNICFFSGRPDQDRIETCARMAAVHDDIISMPMGYGTLIGDMGTVLSGGQKQR
ncbi:MAG: ATP-binding cassette domain-containing protein, partial [Acetobacteraceae bacterium]|nr:ATP-binding cassette domain-containing protein [Acetobacteraceae bacterium]